MWKPLLTPGLFKNWKWPDIAVLAYSVENRR